MFPLCHCVSFSVDNFESHSTFEYQGKLKLTILLFSGLFFTELNLQKCPHSHWTLACSEFSDKCESLSLSIPWGAILSHENMYSVSPSICCILIMYYHFVPIPALSSQVLPLWGKFFYLSEIDPNLRTLVTSSYFHVSKIGLMSSVKSVSNKPPHHFLKEEHYTDHRPCLGLWFKYHSSLHLRRWYCAWIIITKMCDTMQHIYHWNKKTFHLVNARIDQKNIMSCQLYTPNWVLQT